MKLCRVIGVLFVNLFVKLLDSSFTESSPVFSRFFTVFTGRYWLFYNDPRIARLSPQRQLRLCCAVWIYIGSCQGCLLYKCVCVRGIPLLLLIHKGCSYYLNFRVRVSFCVSMVNSVSVFKMNQKKCLICGSWLHRWNTHSLCIRHQGIAEGHCREDKPCDACRGWQAWVWTLYKYAIKESEEKAKRSASLPAVSSKPTHQAVPPPASYSGSTARDGPAILDFLNQSLTPGQRSPLGSLEGGGSL